MSKKTEAGEPRPRENGRRPCLERGRKARPETEMSDDAHTNSEKDGASTRDPSFQGRKAIMPACAACRVCRLAHLVVEWKTYAVTRTKPDGCLK